MYQNILNGQGLTTDKNSWEIVKKDLSNGRRMMRIQSAFEAQKEVKYFFLQHFLFSLLLSADKGDMMLDGDTKRDLVFLKNHLLPFPIINDFKAWKHKDISLYLIEKQIFNVLSTKY